MVPQEPVLPLDEIQGIVVPGFFKPHQTLVGIRMEDSPDAALTFKKLLKDISREISTGKQTLDDRRRFRDSRSSGGTRKADSGPLLAVGFTFRGLRRLTAGASAIQSDAFRQGLAARSASLGDPAGKKDEGSAANWKVGAPGEELDALFVIAGGSRVSVDRGARKLVAKLKQAGLKVAYTENGDVRDDLPGHEHFGFDDGVSQPGIRGRASEAADDYITPRYIASSQVPEHSLFALPGQDLVWPGEFVLGYPATSPDPLIPGAPAQAVPEWTHNGSFLVFRRLRQDVGLFWRTIKQEATRLNMLPGFAGLSDVQLASRIVGRWPSGAPVNRAPNTDDASLGKDKLANNHFRFDSDASALHLSSGAVDSFLQSKADPAGITCPWAAHIRKVNTRDSGSDTGGRDSTYARRVLRVGVPFGKPLKNRYAGVRNDPQKGNRGLLFLSIQASIEEQFEFLVKRWMGDPTRPKMPGGHDLLVGQNDAPGENRVRRCVLFGSSLEQASIATKAQWIVPTGGGYFFIPSISALRNVIAV